ESPAFGTPTTYTVTDTSDNSSDTGSLRYLITQANANTNPAGSKITFNIPTSDPGYNPSSRSWTIALASTLDLREAVWPEVIDATGVAGTVRISGNHAAAVFHVSSATAAAISGLTITDGNGGGVCNDGTVTITDCTITGNLGGGIRSSYPSILAVW